MTVSTPVTAPSSTPAASSTAIPAWASDLSSRVEGIAAAVAALTAQKPSRVGAVTSFIGRLIPQNLVWDVVGLGFAGTAIYGFITGRMDTSSVEAAIALAASYMGLKRPL